jgi:hypothetical protein
MEKQNKYNNACIYMIKCKDESIKEVYIGSTCNFNQRKALHKYHCNNQNCIQFQYFIYQFIRQNNGWDNFEMMKIEQVVCETKKELESVERKHIEKYNSRLNKYIPNQTRKERYQSDDVKQIINQRNNSYYQKHKDNILEKRKEKIICDCGHTYTKSNKARHMKTKKHLQYLESQQL